MARAVRDPFRQAARLGLLTAAAGCAVVEQPPGGPPDFDAPTIVSVTPDSGAIVPELDKPLRIQFDEVIAEQAGGRLAQLIEFSPRVEELDVSWKRDALEVEPKGGWTAGVVYRVVLLPGIADLRDNRLTEGRTVVFSTGGPIPETSLTGTVVDWQDGRIGRNALVEAVLLPDSLVYLAQSDSVGRFDLTSVPRGEYWVTATVDGNNNRRREPREPFDSVTVALDSAASHVFWAFTRDTLGPQLRQLTQADSVTIRLEFTQRLEPGDPDAAGVSVWVLPDTVAVPVRAVITQAVFDTLRAARQAAAPDTSGAETPDSAVAAAVGRVPTGVEARADSAAAQETSAVAALLAQRPTLASAWFVELAAPMTPGLRYLVGARARNLSGATAESRSVLVVPAARDST
jgi:hypothetical protein